MARCFLSGCPACNRCGRWRRRRSWRAQGRSARRREPFFDGCRTRRSGRHPRRRQFRVRCRRRK
ncbi:MAG: hypothetical protein EXS29_01785 [Pedosphaera sp.]|nr:hypothetical protein [Pedosphaera sp.]MST00029.1 hypothetical protein [Pedosphaera sp.]